MTYKNLWQLHCKDFQQRDAERKLPLYLDPTHNTHSNTHSQAAHGVEPVEQYNSLINSFVMYSSSHTHTQDVRFITSHLASCVCGPDSRESANECSALLRQQIYKPSPLHLKIDACSCPACCQHTHTHTNAEQATRNNLTERSKLGSVLFKWRQAAGTR